MKFLLVILGIALGTGGYIAYVNQWYSTVPWWAWILVGLLLTAIGVIYFVVRTCDECSSHLIGSWIQGNFSKR